MPLRDLHHSTMTRIRCIYDLSAPLPYEGPRTPLGDTYDFGRFQRHLDISAVLTPTVILREVLSTATLTVLATPRHDALVLLDIDVHAEASAADIAEIVAQTCFDRDQLRVDDRLVLDIVQERLGLDRPLRFGRNVHQCIFAGGRLLEEIFADPRPNAPTVATVVLRGNRGADRGGPLGIIAPTALNNPGETVVAHGRGVSLFGGFAPAAENALSLSAMVLVSALGVLHRVRDQLFAALAANSAARLESTGDARTLVSQLSDELNEAQLDLSFGVEAYTDGMLLPELLIWSFHRSLSEVNGIGEVLTNTSRMVERLGTVIQARAAIMDASAQEQNERRDRLFSVLIAVGSLLALPPGLLLAFFGANSSEVPAGTSMFDIQRYWLVYAIVWLPFLALLGLGMLLRRRIGRSVPHLAGFAKRD